MAALKTEDLIETRQLAAGEKEYPFVWVLDFFVCFWGFLTFSS